MFQSAFALKYPMDPRPPMSTPGLFQRPTKLIDNISTFEIRGPFTYIMSFGIEHSCRFQRKVTPRKRKPFNPTSSTLSTSATSCHPSKMSNCNSPVTFPYGDSTTELQHVDVHQRVTVMITIVGFAISGVLVEAFSDRRK